MGETLIIYPAGASRLDITSPVFVISVLVVLFLAGILFASGSKEDGSAEHD
jgi:hypothetical protein